MKKLLRLLLFLFSIFIIVQILFNIFSSGYKIEYKVDSFDILEIRTQNIKDEIDNYYFEIKTDNHVFSIQTYKNLKLSKKIISEIKYYKDDNYECILPITKKHAIFTDIICTKNNIEFLYHDIKGTNSKLDEFVNSIELYDGKIYEHPLEIKKHNTYISVYNVLPNDMYLGLESYKGIYLINQRDGYYAKDLFVKDTYSKDIHVFIKNYYLTADYDEEFEFHDFYLVNLKNHNIKKLTSNNKISMYSYIQGVINNSVYLLDTASKKQYEINIKTNTVIEIGNETTGMKYYKDNKFETINIYEGINNKLLFEENISDNNFNNEYDKVEKVGNKKSGYYYLFKKNNNKYDVYRINVQNLNIKYYLFSTDDINNIIYIDDSVYFKEGEYIKYYSDSEGIIFILKNNEINFNSNLIFGISR